MSHLPDCLFCKIAKREIPDVRVYEDELVFAMMDIFPESKGHLLIIPKNHAENLFECDEKTLAHIIKVSQRLAAAAKTALKADGVKIVQFNGEAAGQTVFHYHMHVVPAYANVGFKRHADEPADGELLQEQAQLIKAALN